MKVPLLDLKPQYEALKSDIDAALRSVCESQHFILGPGTQALEAEVAAYSQTKHGIGVSSGTDALLVALMALDIGHGDEVITTPFTFFATAGTIARTGARPVFCDIDPATFNISPAAIDGKIGKATKAIMPVHLYGQVADMNPIMSIAKRHELRVIEDAAQAIGSADAKGRRACSFGDIGCLSFFPTKNLGAFGDAGMCVTNDAALAERLNILRVHGGKPKYYHAYIGGNFRIDEIQSVVLRIKLRHLDDWSAGRQRNAAIYDSLFAAAKLGDAVMTPPAIKGARHIYNQYVIRAMERDALRAFLAEQGVGTEIYYPVPMHLQQCFAYLGHKPGDFPESERAAAEVLALPIFPELTREQLEYVVDRVVAFYRRG